MTDKIRKAYKKWCDEQGCWYEDMPEMAKAFEAGATSRDAEISELVEVVNEMQLAISDPQVSYEEMVALSIKAKRIVSRYTKTPCPEDQCVGGKITIWQGIEACSINCPTCQARGYKWERKE